MSRPGHGGRADRGKGTDSGRRLLCDWITVHVNTLLKRLDRADSVLGLG
ncbi:hypothetical protein [Streptomyces aureus]